MRKFFGLFVVFLVGLFMVLMIWYLTHGGTVGDAGYWAIAVPFWIVSFVAGGMFARWVRKHYLS
jgi:hypothetical protein